MRKALISAIMFFAFAASPGFAQSAGSSMPGMMEGGTSPKCDVVVAPPAEMKGWTKRGLADAAVDADGLAKAVLLPGVGVDAALSQTSAVRYVVRPEKPGGSVSYGGMFAFDIAKAGTYRIALGSGAWIDVLKDGVAVISVAHGHGPDCTGIRKMVDFKLEPGRYTLQLAANGSPSLPVLIVRLP